MGASLSLADSVSALQANSSATGTISDAIANAQTHGYKQSTSYFKTLVTGSAGNFAAGGVLSRVVQNVGSQGILETSDSPTHLAISGNGFFVVSRSANTQEIEYTRAGHFFPDNRGNLQNVSGVFLQGWATDENGNVGPNITTSDLASLQTINVSKVSGLAKASSAISLQLNLPSGSLVGDTEITNMPIYDALGARHTMTVTWTRTVITPNTWTAEITCPDAATINKTTDGSPYSGGTALVVEFDGTGKPMSYDGVAAVGTVAPGIDIAWDPLVTNADPQIISFGLGTIGTLDGITSRSGEYSAPTIQEDGREFGTFQSVSIATDGIVSAVYSNGQSLSIARIAVANFAAPDLLESKTGNSWIETDLSGSYVLSFAKAGGVGEIVANALEKSTVDLAASMTDLIELQNHYVSNTKAISTKKSMFDALMNVKS